MPAICTSRRRAATTKEIRLRTLLGSRLYDPGRGGESLTANCLLDDLEILRLHPPRSRECFDVGLDRRLDLRQHLLEAGCTTDL